MKKTLFSLVVLLVTCSAFSQKIIDNPECGLNELPGSITKIELTAEATILHFHIKYQPGIWIAVPKGSYIKDVNGEAKYFVTKSEGIPLGEKYFMPKSGEVSYQLYFPKLDSSINKIDFGEANEGGNWSVYDIVINEQEEKFLIPKELKGNWFQTDGSNQWDYGFYASNAVFDKALWNYKTVDKNKNKYTIVLERNGIQKTLYAQIDKKGGMSFGFDKQKMKNYSASKVDKVNYKPANDDVYVAEAIFKSDTATYSGVIKGYTPRKGKKTGTVNALNVFAGVQDSYLVKIADDGSFSVKFPIAYPQSIFVRLPTFNGAVFVEPGKETFQVIDKNTSLFMGDCAGINSDINTLEKIVSYVDYNELEKTISQANPQDYKKSCLEIKNKQMQALDEFTKKQFISQKALQIKRKEIEFLSFEKILYYELKREDSKLDASYYDFISKSILDDELGVLATNYYYFINRLMYAKIFGNSSVSVGQTMSEIMGLLQKSGITFSDEELEMIAASKELEKISMKLRDFYTNNRVEIRDFIKNHKEANDKLQKDNPRKGASIGDLGAYLSTQGVAFTAEEKKLLGRFKSVEYTKEEKAMVENFTGKYGERLKEYNEKYKTEINDVLTDNFSQKTADKMKELFALNEAFAFDVITLQRKVSQMEKNFMPYTDAQLKSIQAKIKHPFLSNYIVLENNKIKAKIEANKKQSGYVINTVKKTEGDELFESMIAKFKGKVIYVDFWATWCGPCMSGIKEIASLKEDMKNDDVMFLYITNQTSPEQTWNNSIPNIKGEHYRVSQDEWNYLAHKFNISGIPHYVLVNKKGEIVNPKLGFNHNEALRKILEGQLE